MLLLLTVGTAGQGTAAAVGVDIDRGRRTWSVVSGQWGTGLSRLPTKGALQLRPDSRLWLLDPVAGALMITIDEVPPGTLDLTDRSGSGTLCDVSDPQWPTVKLRWQGVNGPVPVPADLPDWMKRVYKLMPSVETWRKAAVEVLNLAEASLSTSPPTGAQQLAMDLVNRVFKLSSSPGQTTAQSIADIKRIKEVFAQIKLLIEAITKGERYLHESVDPAHAKDIAYTVPGHWAKKKPADGIWYVKAKIEKANDEFVIDATMHEFAHFCGPSGAKAVDHARVKGKLAYGDLALTLGKSQALVNASSYAWLAYLARKPSDVWLTAT